MARKARKAKSDKEPREAAPAQDELTEIEDEAEDPAAADEAVAAEEEGEPDYEALYKAANDKWLRAKAEFENYRRRVQREFAEIRTQSKLLTVQEFLSLYDHFRMAVDHAEQSSDADSLREGLQLITAEFSRTLENLGVTPMESVGEPFDPELHEAIAQEASSQVPEGHVLRQWKTGFVMGERLVRPATVVVSAGAPAEDASGKNEPETS